MPDKIREIYTHINDFDFIQFPNPLKRVAIENGVADCTDDKYICYRINPNSLPGIYYESHYCTSLGFPYPSPKDRSISFKLNFGRLIRLLTLRVTTSGDTGMEFKIDLDGRVKVNASVYQRHKEDKDYRVSWPQLLDDMMFPGTQNYCNVYQIDSIFLKNEVTITLSEFTYPLKDISAIEVWGGRLVDETAEEVQP